MTDRPLVVVIGAGPGMGRAIARRFGRDGFRLAVFSRSRAAAEAEALRDEGFEATGQALDAADAEAVAAAMRGIGPVRVLAWNAVAITRVTPLQLPPARLMTDLAVSVAGPLAAVQAVVPAMEAAGGGSILFTGGGFALRPRAAVASVGVAKAALRNLAMSLAEELAPRGIRVGTVTIHGMVAPGTAFDPDAIAAAYAAIHADRAGALGVETAFTGEA